MFEKFKNAIKDKIQELQKLNAITVNTEIFNDPKAKLIDWQPLKSGGSNFKTSSLIKVSDMHYKYNLSTQGKLFIGLFLIIGMLVFIGGLALISEDTAGWGLLAFGSLFIFGSLIIYKFMGKPINIDYSIGCVWKGNKPPQLSGNRKESADSVFFSDIYSFQIIKERVHSKNNSYYSYELNLVLKDNSRFNLIDHGNIQQIRKDAEVLSAFLGKPIWDATI
jgi:hypothetical protein